MNTYARTSRVENFLNMLLTKAGLSKHIFISHLPVTIEKEWNDVVLIDVGQGRNFGAHHQFSANIFLIARPLGQLQQKNVRAIDTMEQKLEEAVSSCSDVHYHPTISWRDADYDDTINFHFNVVNLAILVNE